MQKILPPETCPSCNGQLIWEKDQLFCKSKNCESKLYKSIEHFAKILRIKGLGPATILKLDIKHIADIYDLSYGAMEAVIGSKLAEKLQDEINKSLEASLNDVLPAFGIPLIGNTASNKVCNVISHVLEISTETCKKAGLGPKATENLIHWSENDLNDVIGLGFSYKTKKLNTKEPMGIVCISGKLNTYKTKSVAAKALESAGFLVKTSLTKDVDILINESGIASSKTKRAQDLGIKIINNINDIL